MATAIMNPNETISDQFANSVIELSNGYVVTGRIVTKNKHKIQVAENPYNNKHLTTVKTGDIVSTKISPYSPMPPGLINMLNENELLDLFAYIFSWEPLGIFTIIPENCLFWTKSILHYDYPSPDILH